MGDSTDLKAESLLRQYPITTAHYRTFYVDGIKYRIGCRKCNSTKLVHLKKPFQAQNSQKQYYFSCKNCKMPVDPAAIREKG